MSIKIGMFDSVNISCPNCGVENLVQTKSGDCTLQYYNFPLENAKNPAPDDVMEGINQHSPFTCLECGCKFKVEIDWNLIKHFTPEAYKIVEIK